MRNEKEIREAEKNYDILKMIIEDADQYINDVFVDVVRSTLDWVLKKSEVSE